MGEVLQDHVAGEVTQELTLALSELVTNAVVHAGTDFEVVVVEARGTVRIEVEDRSPLPPQPREPSELVEGGRGLRIVGELCDRWGVDLVQDGKRVWCERLLY